MKDKIVPEALTFDDVLLLPAYSSVIPAETDARTILTRKISLNIPIVSAAMDTVSEFRLLEALAQRPGVVLSRAQLLDRVRGSDSVVADRIIDSWVRRLRRKIEAVDEAFSGIETVVGAGYRWRDG